MDVYFRIFRDFRQFAGLHILEAPINGAFKVAGGIFFGGADIIESPAIFYILLDGTESRFGRLPLFRYPGRRFLYYGNDADNGNHGYSQSDYFRRVHMDRLRTQGAAKDLPRQE